MLRDDVTGVTVFEFRNLLHIVSGNYYLTQLSQFLVNQNNQLSTRVCRKSLARTNPVTVMVLPDLCLSSACGNKTSRFKWKRFMGKKRHSNTHLHSFWYSSVCIMGSSKFTRWNHNEWPFVKALANALVTFKLKTLFHFFPPRMIMILSFFFFIIDLKRGLSSFTRMSKYPFHTVCKSSVDI